MAWVPCAMSYRLATVLLCWPHNDMADTVQPTCQAMIRITTHPIYLLDGGSKEREVCEDERSTRSDRFAEMVGSVIVHFSIGHQGGQLCLYYVKLLLISASPS